jgi:2-oxoacid:acceptor oxidoreductase delta subunit (pyruvate/2-ketoisovalerate family)
MAAKLTEGAVVKPASSTVNTTGAWRSFRPVVDLEKCVKCYICIDLCPEGAISALPEKKGVQVDYDYCKGCGICSSECPQKAYTMVPEEK